MPVTCEPSKRRANSFNKTLVDKRQGEERQAELADNSLSKNELRDRERARRRVAAELQQAEDERNSKLESSSIGIKGKVVGGGCGCGRAFGWGWSNGCSFRTRLSLGRLNVRTSPSAA